VVIGDKFNRLVEILLVEIAKFHSIQN